MNSRYTMASIQILDMKNSLMLFTQTYHIPLLRPIYVKTDYLLHSICWVVMSPSDYIIYEKRLLHNSSTQVKSCHLHMKILVFLSSDQMKKWIINLRSKNFSMKFLNKTYSKFKSNCLVVY